MDRSVVGYRMGAGVMNNPAVVTEAIGALVKTYRAYPDGDDMILPIGVQLREHIYIRVRVRWVPYGRGDWCVVGEGDLMRRDSNETETVLQAQCVQGRYRAATPACDGMWEMEWV